MKKCEKFMISARVRLDLAGLRRHLAARPCAHQPVDDDAVTGAETVADNAQTVDDRAWAHDARLNRAVILYQHHDLARLVGDQRAVGNQDRLVTLGPGQAQAAELAGGDEKIGIGEDGAGADGSGAAVDGVVEKVENTLTLPLGLVRVFSTFSTTP